MITLRDLEVIAPKANKDILASLVADAPLVLPAAGISTALRICHFLAQCAHESDGFRTTTEYATGGAYEGRKDLGNIHPGDGVKYKGRGLIQTTGRKNYTFFEHWAKLHYRDVPNFVTKPSSLAKPPWALMSAVYYWDQHNLNALADDNNLLAITHAVNGSYNGLASRRTFFNRAWRQMGLRLEGEAGEVN